MTGDDWQTLILTLLMRVLVYCTPFYQARDLTLTTDTRVYSLEPGSPLTFCQIRNKKGENLEDFDHVLDMVGHGWTWLGVVKNCLTTPQNIKKYLLIFVRPEVEELACG